MIKDEELTKTYQLKKQRDHILDAPDTYVGSVEKDTLKGWIMDGDSMKYGEYELVPALYKCFDEGLVNSRDHYIRQQQKKKMENIKM